MKKKEWLDNQSEWLENRADYGSLVKKSQEKQNR